MRRPDWTGPLETAIRASPAFERFAASTAAAIFVLCRDAGDGAGGVEFDVALDADTGGAVLCGFAVVKDDPAPIIGAPPGRAPRTQVVSLGSAPREGGDDGPVAAAAAAAAAAASDGAEGKQGGAAAAPPSRLAPDSVLPVLQHALSSLLRAPPADADGAASADALAEVRRRLSDLELALVQCRERLAVPRCVLSADKDVALAARHAEDAEAAGGPEPGIDTLGLADLAEDPDRRKELARCLDSWVAEVRRVTDLPGRRLAEAEARRQRRLAGVTELTAARGGRGAAPGAASSLAPASSGFGSGAAGPSPGATAGSDGLPASGAGAAATGAWSAAGALQAELDAILSGGSLGHGGRPAGLGLAAELEFWTTVRAALSDVEGRLAAWDVRLTLALVTRGGFKVKAQSFRGDTGVAAAQETAGLALALLEAAPVRELSTASTFGELREAIDGFFAAVCRPAAFAGAPAIATGLVEQASSDTAARLLVILRRLARQHDGGLAAAPAPVLASVLRDAEEARSAWARGLAALSKAAGTDSGFGVTRLLVWLKAAPDAVLRRLRSLGSLRGERDAILRALSRPSEGGSGEAEAAASADLEDGFRRVASADVLDVTTAGGAAFERARSVFFARVDRVEAMLIRRLRAALDGASGVEAMVAVLRGAGGLVDRPKVQAAVRDSREAVLRWVASALERVEAKVRANYADSSALGVSRLRGLPRFAGMVVWALQLQGRVVRAVLALADAFGGRSADHDGCKETLGRAAALHRRLDPSAVWKDWCDRMRAGIAAGDPAFTVSGPLLRPARSAGAPLGLEVSFGSQLVALDREARAFEQLCLDGGVSALPPRADADAVFAAMGYRRKPSAADSLHAPHDIMTAAIMARRSHPLVVALAAGVATANRALASAAPAFGIVAEADAARVRALAAEGLGVVVAGGAAAPEPAAASAALTWRKKRAGAFVQDFVAAAGRLERTVAAAARAQGRADAAVSAVRAAQPTRQAVAAACRELQAACDDMVRACGPGGAGGEADDDRRADAVAGWAAATDAAAQRALEARAAEVVEEATALLSGGAGGHAALWLFPETITLRVVISSAAAEADAAVAPAVEAAGAPPSGVGAAAPSATPSATGASRLACAPSVDRLRRVLVGRVAEAVAALASAPHLDVPGAAAEEETGGPRDAELHDGAGPGARAAGRRSSSRWHSVHRAAAGRGRWGACLDGVGRLSLRAWSAAKSWGRHRALWRLDLQRVAEAAGDDVGSWLGLVGGARSSRDMLDGDASSVVLAARAPGAAGAPGPRAAPRALLVVDASQFRDRIALQYNHWVGELVSSMSSAAAARAESLLRQLAASRETLERTGADAVRLDLVVEFIRTVREVQASSPGWRDECERLGHAAAAASGRGGARDDAASALRDRIKLCADELDRVRQIAGKRAEEMRRNAGKLGQAVARRVRETAEQVRALDDEWQADKPDGADERPARARGVLSAFRARLGEAAAVAGAASEAVAALAPLSPAAREAEAVATEAAEGAAELGRQVAVLSGVWAELEPVWEGVAAVLGSRWGEFDPGAARARVDDLIAAARGCSPDVQQYEPHRALSVHLASLRASGLPLLALLRGAALRERHWTALAPAVVLRSALRGGSGGGSGGAGKADASAGAWTDGGGSDDGSEEDGAAAAAAGQEERKEGEGDKDDADGAWATARELRESLGSDWFGRLPVASLAPAASPAACAPGSAVDAACRDAVRRAAGEAALETFLRDVSWEWEARELELVPFPGAPVSLIGGWEPLLVALDDHRAGLTSMRGSPFYAPFEEQAAAWEDTLGRLAQALDAWQQVQRRWVHLSTVFPAAGSDVSAALPAEARRFRDTSKDFVAMCGAVEAAPLAVSLARSKGLVRRLERMLDAQQRVQSALGEYLEKQRLAFPRLFFVGDDDVLDVISSGCSAARLQRHLPRMFTGVASAVLAADGEAGAGAVVALASPQGERLPLLGAGITETSRPHLWLCQAEAAMRSSLEALARRACEAAPGGLFGPGDEAPAGGAVREWVSAFPTQAVHVAACASWSAAAASAVALSSGGGAGAGGAVGAVGSATRRRLDALATEAGSPWAASDATARRALETLITETIHQRDVCGALAAAAAGPGGGSALSSEWESKMRYGWGEGGGGMDVRMGASATRHGWEWVGSPEQLVVTPLTERCYFALMQAIQLRLGGSPFGPAGTGKTESVKALGAALGRLVLVFNCDGAFDTPSMARLLAGLCAAGAFGCFDEFNRLEAETLSAVSQLISGIQRAMHGGQAAVSVQERTVPLEAGLGVFVTMNPGYAGRRELPDNLKALFRPVAMMRPDKALIASVTLFSNGFRDADALAGRLVTLFELARDQLSVQTHYDWGLRAMKSVIVAAGRLRRDLGPAAAPAGGAAGDADGPDGDEDGAGTAAAEQLTLVRAVVDSLVPVLVSRDAAVFRRLLASSFPGHGADHVSSEELRAALAVELASRSLAATADTVGKCVQLWTVMQLRHGVVLLGDAGCGKTTAWQVLAGALNRMAGGPGAAAAAVGEPWVIDAKTVSKADLIGQLDGVTGEWRDGIVPALLRQAAEAEAAALEGRPAPKRWIVFDGDVDPEWAESLNSLLDDNKILSLPSGERLPLPSGAHVVFEVDSLAHATPATVSRCGMVWLPGSAVTPVMRAGVMLRALRSAGGAPAAGARGAAVPGAAAAADRDAGGASLAASSAAASAAAMPAGVAAAAADAFESVLLPAPGAAAGPCLLDECVAWVAAEGGAAMGAAVGHVYAQVEGLLAQGCAELAEHAGPGGPPTPDEARAFASRWAVFSALWGSCSACMTERREAMAAWLATRADEALLPPSGSLAAWRPVLRPAAGAAPWRRWLDASAPDPEVDLRAVTDGGSVISTEDTARNEAVVRGWMRSGMPAVLCGPPGSGKTMTLQAVLSSTPGLSLAVLNFSSGTTPASLLRFLEQHCVYASTPRGVEMRPAREGSTLVVLCDEVNLPAPDAFGSQQAIAFLRHVVEQGGFWRPGKAQRVTVRDVKFVAACNPPTDPGRHPLPPRFLRHAPVLLVDFPSEGSLRRIYGAFNRALLRPHAALRGAAEAATSAMVRVYAENRARFLPEQQAHYVYSPRELTRWCRAVHAGLASGLAEAAAGDADEAASLLARLVAHEGLRLFADRLVTPEERLWCERSVRAAVAESFGPAAGLGGGPLLFSGWLSGGAYEPCEEGPLRRHLAARLRVFGEEEGAAGAAGDDIVPTDTLLRHALRASRVLSQPGGHLLLIGAPGAGKTLVSRLVSWLAGMSVFRLSAARRYTVADFEEDLRSLIRRASVGGERVVFIFEEGGAVSSAFLERMNSLLASGEVPGLFDGDAAAHLVQDARDRAAAEGTALPGSSEEDDAEAWEWVFSRVRANLHVVFTMNPPDGEDGLASRAATSPALFNRCVVDWFGDWAPTTLAQIVERWLRVHDLELDPDYAPQPADTLGDRCLAAAAAVRAAGAAAGGPAGPGAAAQARAAARGSASGGGAGGGAESDPVLRHASTAAERLALATAASSLAAEGPDAREAVMALLLAVHDAASAVAAASAASGSTPRPVTPRDALELARQFRWVLAERRGRVEEEHRHLSQGLAKLDEATASVAELQGTLGVKASELRDREQRAADKLVELMSDQKAAEAQRDELSRLSETLEARERETAESKEAVEGELGDVEPTLEAAKAAVGGIKTRDLSNLRRLRSPPEIVRLVLQGVVAVVGAGDGAGAPSSTKRLEWDDITRAAAASTFITTVVGFNPETMSAEQMTVARGVLATPGLTQERVEKAYGAVGPLFQWLESQVAYAQILTRVAPLRSRLGELEGQAGALRAEAAATSAGLAEQEASIASLKAEYASLIGEAESLKAAMKDVEVRVGRSRGLLDGLRGEQDRWNGSRDGFGASVACLAGDAALCAAFVTHSARLDFRARRELWEECCDAATRLGVRFSEDLQPPVALAGPRLRQQWTELGLPSDALSVENAAALARGSRYPLIVDPAGSAERWVLAAIRRGGRLAAAGEEGAARPAPLEGASGPGHASTSVVVTTQEDSGFAKALASALRFGTALVVRDVEEEGVDPATGGARGGIDPVLFPVLTNDVRSVGGRSVITVGGADVDMTPGFQLVLLCSSASARFGAAALSRVSVVDFGVTPESLEDRCLDEILRARCPDVQASRGAAVAARASSQARLRELEEGLLARLSAGAGALLDDDKTVAQLRGLQGEAADVREQAAEAERALERADEAAGAYRGPARCASGAYLALEALARVRPGPYAPSLAHFLELLARVLAAAGDAPCADAGQGARAADATRLSSSLLRAVEAVEAAGTLQAHTLALSARLAAVRAAVERAEGGADPGDWPTPEELACLQGGALPSARPPTAGALEAAEACLGDVLAPAELQRLAAAASLPGPAFERLSASLSEHRAAWRAAAAADRLAEVEGAEAAAGDLDAATGLPAAWVEASGLGGAAPATPASAARCAVVAAAVAPARSGAMVRRFAVLALQHGAAAPGGGPAAKGETAAEAADADVDGSVMALFAGAGALAVASPATPVLVAAAPGRDPGRDVVRAAAQAGVKLFDLALGDERVRKSAEAAVGRASRDGGKGVWVLLRNCHLDAEWVAGLVRRSRRLLASASPLSRLWLTAPLLPAGAGVALPASVVAASRCMVLEPEPGLRHAFGRALAAAEPEHLDLARPVELSRVSFAVLWAHAVLEERSRLAPLGFTAPYEFGAPDAASALAIAAAVMRAAAGDPSPWDGAGRGAAREHVSAGDVPWRGLVGALVTAVYGARVSSEGDRLVVAAVLSRLVSPGALAAGFPLSLRPADGAGPEAPAPADTRTAAGLAEWAAAALGAEGAGGPEVLGLPRGSGVRLQAESNAASLRCWAELEAEGRAAAAPAPAASGGAAPARGSAAEGGKADTGREADRAALAALAAAHLPALRTAAGALGSPGAAAGEDGDEPSGPLARALAQEREAAAAAADAVAARLTACADWAAGRVPLTSAIDAEARSLRAGVCPASWREAARAPAGAAAQPASLLAWVADRCQHLAAVSVAGGAQAVARGDCAVWLGGLSQPEAVLQATRQMAAAALSVPLERLVLAAAGGGAAPGLLLVGAASEGWALTPGGGVPTETAASVRLAGLPLSWVDGAPDGCVTLPLFATTSRRRHLATVAVRAGEGWADNAQRLRGAAVAAWFPGSAP